MDIKNLKFFPIIVYLAVIYLGFLLIKPFISVILGALILSYAFYPMHKKIDSKINKPFISAIISTLIIFLIIVLPFIIMLNILALESISAYQDVTSGDLVNLINKITVDERLTAPIQQILDKMVLFFVQASSKLVLSIPSLILNFFLLFFITFYVLKDGKGIAETVKSYIPIKNKQFVFIKFERLTKALIYGTLLVAVVQGVLGAIGFYIFDVPSPILWGSAMAIASFIPAIGTALIWVPAGLFKLLQADYVSGIGILIFGALIIGTADNIIKPYFVGSHARVHPVVVLIGVLGGLQVFGFIGVIIGPLVLSLALEFIRTRNSINQ